MQRKPKASARPQEGDGGERRRGVQRERVDDVRLDRLEVQDRPGTDECDALEKRSVR